MTDDAPCSADLNALARDYLDAWQRHLTETAKQAELPTMIGRLYARTDPADIDAWKAAWRGILDPGGDPGATDDPPAGTGGAGHGG